MAIGNELDEGIKELIRLMQHLEEQCYKSTFSANGFSLELKALDRKIKNIEAMLDKMIEKQEDNRTSDRIQVMKEVLVVFERKVNYFTANVPLHKDAAANECQILQSSFQVFTELYDSFR